MMSKHRIVVNRSISAADDNKLEVESVDSFTKASMIVVDLGKGPNTNFFNWKEYLKFSVGFSLSLVPVSATIVFAPSFLPLETGGIGIACFFLGQAFFSILFSKAVVKALGCKACFIYFSVVNIFYTWGFHIIVIYGNEGNGYYFLFPIISTIGGIAHSIMWTAQALYFVRASNIMVNSLDVESTSKMNQQLANDFSKLFMIVLIACYISCVIVFIIGYIYNGITMLYVIAPIYSAFVLTSLFLLIHIDNLGDIGEGFFLFRPDQGLQLLFEKTRSLRIVRRYKILLLVPYHMSYGFCTAFWIYYVLGQILANENGNTYDSISKIILGVAVLINSLVSFLFTVICSNFFQNVSNTNMIVFGGSCFSALGVAFLFIPETKRSSYAYSILFGIGRSVFDSNMQAVLADFFPEGVQSSHAFSLMAFSRSVATGISFVINVVVQLSDTNTSLFLIFFGLFGVFGYLVAAQLDRLEKAGQFAEPNSARNTKIYNAGQSTDLSRSLLPPAIQANQANIFLKSNERDLNYVSESFDESPYVPEYF